MARRGKGEGSIRKRTDGRWEASLTVGYTDKGNPKRRFIYAKTRGEVTKKLAELQVAFDKGLLSNHTHMTLGEWLWKWLEDRQHSLEGSTIDSYERLIRLHIIPVLGDIKLTAVRPLHLKSFYTRLAKSSLSYRSQAYIHSLVFSALKEALRLELVPRNVAELVRPEGKKDKRETITWTPDEANSFLDVAKEDRLFAAFYLMLCLGLRRGEVLGLRWSDIDFDTSTIFIRQSLRKGKKGRAELAKPKTASSKRELHAPDDVMLLLRNHKNHQEQERDIAVEAWEDSGLVFTTQVGTFIHPDNLKRPFKRLCEEAGVNSVTLHGLRHSYTSLVLSRGVDAKVVSERLGHSDVAFTLRTYQHIYKSQRKESALSMKQLLGKRKDEEE